MDKFSKKDYEICPNCGEMKPVPTGVTPQQIEDGDWQCQDCYNRSGRDYEEEKSVEHGKKPISKYDPEYEFLVKLVKLLVQEGVSAQEIRDIANAYPFETIDDVGDLAAKLWTLATQKYQIPSDWLRKRLGKTAALKLSKSDSGYVDNGKGYTCGRCAYFDAKNGKCSLVKGDIKAQGCCNFWNDKVVEKLEKPEYTKKEAVYIEYPDVNYRCDECKFFDSEKKTCTKVEGEISPTASCNLWAPISNKKADLYQGQEESQDMINHAPGYLAYQYGQEKESKPKGLNINDIVKILNEKDPKVVHIDVGTKTLDLADGSKISFDDAVKRLIAQNKEGTFSGNEFSLTNIGENPVVTNDPFSSPEDHGVKPQKSPFPNTNWLPADDENKDEQPPSNVASSKRPFSKKAGLDSRYWLAPDGKVFDAGTHHGAWVRNNKNVLKEYGINLGQNLSETYNEMFQTGWTRVSNERGFTVQVADLQHIPGYLDNFIAANFAPGDVIRIGTDTEMVEISDPFPSLQRAINKELRFSRKASLTPQAYWIDPNGTWYTVRGKGLPEITHSGWASDNVEMLKEKYPELGLNKNLQMRDLYSLLINNGWIRIGDSWGASYQIETIDALHLPSAVIDWIYQNVSDGESVEIADYKRNQYAKITMPVNDIQKEIVKEFRQPVAASLKEADLGGRTVNDIVNKIHQNGGVTYNLGQGDMSGTNNFAVSIYPDRSQIIDGGIDFDAVEGFLETNMDLLSDANNSFGAWSHDGKTYLDIVRTVENYDEAVNLGKEHNQIAIWDLRNNNEIPTGGTGEVVKTSEVQLLTEEDQNQIAAKTSPTYVIAVNNYAEALRRGHGKDRSLEYAIESVANVDKIDPKKLVEIINTYL